MRGTAHNRSTWIEVRGGEPHQLPWFVQMFNYIVRVDEVELAKSQCLGVVIAGGLNDRKRRENAVSLLNFLGDGFETYIANALLGKSRAKFARTCANF